MHLELWSNYSALAQRQAAADLLRCNEFTGQYGLRLSPEQAIALVERRGRALGASGRVEFGGGVQEKLVRAFCDSPYLGQHEYATFLGDLTVIFYEFKNETLDRLTDDELISAMVNAFNGPCQGSLELLEERELVFLAQNLRQGRAATAVDPLLEEDRRQAEEEAQAYAGD